MTQTLPNKDHKVTNTTMSESNSHADQARKPGTGRDSLRILVACQVGRTGKSTVADIVLATRLDGKIFSVDSVNQDASQYGAKVRSYFADDLLKLRRDMMQARHPVIVDLGASDFAVFVEKMAAANLFMDFTHCVIVTDPTQRGQEEALTTYETLRGLGMDRSKFRFVLNKARTVRKIALQFEYLFAYAAENPDFEINADCWLPEHDLFIGLHESGQGYREVLADTTDYQPLIDRALEAGDRELASEHSLRQINQRMAMGMQIHFDRCFAALDIPVTE
ncbi:hypothetical protein [Paraburkholderia sp. MM5482-R1]